YSHLLIGVCLPISCTTAEAEDIVKLSSDQLTAGTKRTVILSAVKTPHNSYNIFADPVFWTLV
ncbi:unnamed protein product, partial [Nesidiocoris tenuis]